MPGRTDVGRRDPPCAARAGGLRGGGLGVGAAPRGAVSRALGRRRARPGGGQPGSTGPRPSGGHHVTGLPAALVAQAGASYDAARISPADVAWVEGRTDGREVLVRWTAEHGSQDVTPDGLSVASYVHEYGGGAWAADGDTVWFCNATDQRVYQQTAGAVIPVTPAPPRPGAVRYADLRCDPHRNLLGAVRERHETGGGFNDLVNIPLETRAAPRTAAAGWDFYSFPRPSPDG